MLTTLMRTRFLYCLMVVSLALCTLSIKPEEQKKDHNYQSQETTLDTYSNTAPRHKIMYSVLALLALALFIIGPWLMHSKQSLVNYYTASFLVSAALIVSIGFIWLAAHAYPAFNRTVTPITTQNHIATIHNKRAPGTTAIPTGILLTDAEFTNSRNLQIAGYLWQTYPQGFLAENKADFLLPQATTMTKKLVSSTRTDTSEQKMWHINATIYLPLNYTHYPFDHKLIPLTIAPFSLENKTILTPDLEKLSALQPEAHPGLDKTLTMPGWQLRGSYFGYDQDDEHPTLHLYIMAQRNLLGTIIDDLIPAAVLALLIFIIALTFSARHFLIFGNYATLFFGIVVAQLRFRGELPTQSVAYFEYIYLLLYCLLFFMIISDMLYLKKIPLPWPSYEDNAIPRILYWPLLCTLFLGITLCYLY